MNDQLFSPSRASYIQTMRRKFLKTLKPTELSVKVLTGWRSGDLFVGAKRAADALDDDPDILQLGGRRWGGGNGFGEGFVRYDPIEIEAFRRKQACIVDEKPDENDRANPDDEDDKSIISEEQARNEAFLWETGDVSYPFCCFKARNRKAIALWLSHVVLGLGFFAAGIYFSIVNLNWAGLPAWCYMVFAGVVLMAPIVSWLVVLASIRMFRELADRVQNPKMPERAEPMLNMLYLNEKMSLDLVVLFTYFFYTISFLLLFANYPKDQVPWTNAYRYLTAILGTLTVHSLGSVFAQYLTHTITKEVNVHSLGHKLRSVLRAEVALWRILEIAPDDADFKLYRLMEDPFLTYDPKKAADLARALVKTPMSGIYKRRRPGAKSRKVDIKIETDTEAALLGSWAYASLMKATHKSSFRLGAAAQQQFPVLRRLSSWRSGASGSATHLDAIISDYYSPEERALSNFKRIHKRTVEQYQELVRDSQLGGFNLAYKVFKYLDLAMPLDFLRPGIETAASEEPWSKLGVVRGVPKKFVTKEDLESALKLYESDLAGLPKINAASVWDFFDPEHVGRVALKRAKLAVKGLVQDRKNLKTTLENTAQVVKKLRSVISTGINFFVFLCALAIFGLDVLEVWVGISSIVLAFSFVFGGTLKGVFDAVVFLFGVHPYDVGDKIKLGPTEDVYWIKRISLMSTQMTRWDGASVRFMNQYLFGVYPLINVRRSGNHEKTISMFIDAASLPSRSELEKIQFEFEQFLARSPGSYTGSCSVTARDIIQPLHVKITIWWAFAYPDLDSGRTYRDTSKVLQFLLAAFRKRQVKVSGVNSGQIDLDKGGSKKVVGLQGTPGTTRII